MPDKNKLRDDTIREMRTTEPEVSVLNDRSVIEATNTVLWLSGWATKIILGLVSLLFLATGFASARHDKATFWQVACGLGIIVVIASTIKLRARWMFLVFPLSFLLFVASCEPPKLWPIEVLRSLGGSR